MIFLIVVFWFCLGAIFYSYLLYPMILFAIVRVPFIYRQRPKRLSTTSEILSVSIVIAAYNEERVIRSKLINSLSLDYPKDMLDVWVVSDGSSDKTNEIVMDYVNKYKRVHLIEVPRRGKASALNEAMNCIKSDIVVFSDANTEFSHDSIEKLLRHFGDPMVGCVSGRLIYRNPSGLISGKGESLYWRYETTLKRLESKLGYVAGANGAIYAIRRELFELLPNGTVNDDFMVSMTIVKKGFKSIYDEHALAYEDVSPSVGGEFKRHVRDGGGHYISVIRLLNLLNPFLGVRAFIYWSHRVLRWAGPFMLIITLIVNIWLLNAMPYKGIFMLQMGFYVTALIGFLSLRTRKLPFFLYMPFYFCALNTALFIGFLRALTRRQTSTWQSTERLLKESEKAF